MTPSEENSKRFPLQPQESQQSSWNRRQFIGFSAATLAALALPKPAWARTATPNTFTPPSLTLPSDTGFYQPKVITSVSSGDGSYGILTSTLNIEPKLYSDVDAPDTYVRAFQENGAENTSALTPGPTLCVNPGDDIQLSVYNKLPEDTPPPSSEGNVDSTYCQEPMESLMNRPNCLNTTNLHFHGLHVSPMSQTDKGEVVSAGDPHVTDPIAISSDDVLYELHPGKHHYYCPWLPAFHAPGTHWYHSHRHGSTAIQVAGGMVGALIVKEPEGQELCPGAPDVVMIIQEEPQSLTQNDFGTDPQQEAAFEKLTAQEKLDRGIYERKGSSSPGVFRVNGQIKPQLTLQKGEIQRWRIINANSTPRAFMQLELRAGDAQQVSLVDVFIQKQKQQKEVPNGALQTLYRVAVDGITLYGKPMSDSSVQLESVPLAPGNRVDLFAKLEPGIYTLWMKADATNGAGASQDQDLATIEVTETDFPEAAKVAASFQKLLNDGIPTTGKPAYLDPIDDSDIQENKTPVVFQTGGSALGGIDRVTTPGRGKFTITNTKYEHTDNMVADLDSSQEWILANVSGAGHPFHIHVNPFLVVERAAIYSETITAIGDIKGKDSAAQEEIHTILNNDLDWTKDGVDDTIWWDTFTVPPNTAYKIRHRFDDYWGNFVLHCHILIHEDQGMMWNVKIDNVDDKGANPCQQLLTPIVLSGAVSTNTASTNVFANGTKIALQADTGKWFSRCNGCQPMADRIPDTVTVHIDDPQGLPYAQFEVVDVGNGKIALKADTGKYVARCRGCVIGAAYPDSLTIHVNDPAPSYAQFTPERLPNGKYAFKADTGKYVARCRGCSPNSAYPDTVTIHVEDPTNAPYAQWNVVAIES